jgi:hypothetical protein
MRDRKTVCIRRIIKHSILMKTNVDNNDVEITPRLHNNADGIGFNDVVLLDIHLILIKPNGITQI